jgi:hypothetical protein
MVEHPAVIKGRNRNMTDKRRYSDRKNYLIQAVRRRRKNFVRKQLHTKVADARFVDITNVSKRSSFIMGTRRIRILVYLIKATHEVGRK